MRNVGNKLPISKASYTIRLCCSSEYLSGKDGGCRYNLMVKVKVKILCTP